MSFIQFLQTYSKELIFGFLGLLLTVIIAVIIYQFKKRLNHLKTKLTQNTTSVESIHANNNKIKQLLTNRDNIDKQLLNLVEDNINIEAAMKKEIMNGESKQLAKEVKVKLNPTKSQ